jgi:hypothetical protein
MKSLGLALSVVAAIALMAGLAEAKAPTTYSGTSTVEVKATTIAGKISSSKAACRSNRKVQGSWVAPGQHLLTEAVTTNSAGKWVIDFEVSAGSKGRLGIDIAPKSLGGGATCKGIEVSKVVAK